VIVEVNPESTNWLACAHYDLETARHMLATGRNLYVVFMCHLAVEKALKALVCEGTGSSPPRTHDLLRLRRLAAPALEPDAGEFLAQLNDASVTTRYPHDLPAMV
jgi:HEPN domain-containing protein